jgi:hypothetical protein
MSNPIRDEDVYLQLKSGCWRAVDLAARYKCSVEEIHAMRRRGVEIIVQRGAKAAAEKRSAKRRRASALGWETRRRRARRADEVVAALQGMWNAYQSRQAA